MFDVTVFTKEGKWDGTKQAPGTDPRLAENELERQLMQMQLNTQQ